MRKYWLGFVTRPAVGRAESAARLEGKAEDLDLESRLDRDLALQAAEAQSTRARLAAELRDGLAGESTGDAKGPPLRTEPQRPTSNS
jgi:hypothetical protein